MVEPTTVAAVLLMAAAVIGSVAPMVPGALLSIAGILVYWWGTGYTRPGTFFLAGFLLAGTFSVLFDYLSGVIAAKAGGASTRTSIAAGMVGFLLFFVIGPVGLLIGIAGTVFLRELLRTDNPRSSFRAAAYSTVGVLGSAAVQLVVTASLLVAFLIALAV